MKYSFITPRKKTALTQELKLVLGFFSMTIFMLIATYLFLVFKEYQFTKNKADIVQKRYELKIAIEDMKQQIGYINNEVALSKEIYNHNSLLKESITNLFDLIPSRITLSEAKLLENGLILYGITPSKDTYNFMLHAPLRSIFHKTYTSFYPAKNGWYRFVSTNYVETVEVKEEEVTEDED